MLACCWDDVILIRCIVGTCSQLIIIVDFGCVIVESDSSNDMSTRQPCLRQKNNEVIIPHMYKIKTHL